MKDKDVIFTGCSNIPHESICFDACRGIGTISALIVCSKDTDHGIILDVIKKSGRDPHSVQIVCVDNIHNFAEQMAADSREFKCELKITAEKLMIPEIVKEQKIDPAVIDNRPWHVIAAERGGLKNKKNRKR